MKNSRGAERAAAKRLIKCRPYNHEISPSYIFQIYYYTNNKRTLKGEMSTIYIGIGICIPTSYTEVYDHIRVYEVLSTHTFIT